MYSELMLLPDRKDGFVFLINGEAESARTVLGEALLKHFTKPGDTRDVTWYADVLQRTDEQASKRAAAPDTSAATPVAPAALAAWTGRYRDPWLGDLLLCPRNGRVHFAVAKSPRLNGDVMRLGKRDLVHWSKHGMDPDAWLDFHPAQGGRPATLTMAKVDPLGDFSSDYEDLHFTRTGNCP
jgi:hypothetical protein